MQKFKKIVRAVFELKWLLTNQPTNGSDSMGPASTKSQVQNRKPVGVTPTHASPLTCRRSRWVIFLGFRSWRSVTPVKVTPRCCKQHRCQSAAVQLFRWDLGLIASAYLYWIVAPDRRAESRDSNLIPVCERTPNHDPYLVVQSYDIPNNWP